MNLLSSLRSLAMMAVSFVALEAVAQPTADKPDLKVGDKWEFKQSVKVVPGEEKSDAWSRRVVEIQPDGRVYVAVGKDERLPLDAMLNRIDPRGAEYSVPTYKFPMKIGNEWSYSAKAGEAGMAERRGSYKVVAYEPVTVRAGTFDCFRIEGQWETSMRNYTGRAREQYWYCPAIKFIAKSSFQFDQSFSSSLKFGSIWANLVRCKHFDAVERATSDYFFRRGVRTPRNPALFATALHFSTNC